MKAATVAIILLAAAILIQQTTSARAKGKARYVVGKPGAHYVGNMRKQDRWAHKRTPKGPETVGNNSPVKPAPHLQGTETETPGQQLGETETTASALRLNGIPDAGAAGMPGMMNGMGYPGMMGGMGGYGGIMDPMAMGMGMGMGPGMGMGMGRGMRNGMGNNMVTPLVAGQLGQAIGRAAAGIARAVMMGKRNSAAAAAASSYPWASGHYGGGAGAHGSAFGGGGGMEPLNLTQPAAYGVENSTEVKSSEGGKNLEDELKGLSEISDEGFTGLLDTFIFHVYEIITHAHAFEARSEDCCKV
ncbi:elastin isoform X2 [Rhipicephalus sanguineus]|uniref:elastin isoform X2 n=1 Tax=Rhipicephalus sanguineus TaxID=34632 RepID=UPI001894ABD0|nr:elastin isoform X2 [Rhipicephalus sanguineus]